MLHERSLTGKKWLLRKGSLGENIVSALADERGIHLGKEVLWSSLSDPLGLSSMNDAIERIHHAIKTHETVGIIGDYDADGITGTAQLVRYFRRHRIEPEVILPHRIRHGYGVKKEFVEEMHKKNASLIITVDTGITAIEEIAYARSLGIDVIVTDHHSHSEELPDAIIVHPSVEISNPPSERTFVRAGNHQRNPKNQKLKTNNHLSLRLPQQLFASTRLISPPKRPSNFCSTLSQCLNDSLVKNMFN